MQLLGALPFELLLFALAHRSLAKTLSTRLQSNSLVIREPVEIPVSSAGDAGDAGGDVAGGAATSGGEGTSSSWSEGTSGSNIGEGTNSYPNEPVGSEPNNPSSQQPYEPGGNDSDGSIFEPIGSDGTSSSDNTESSSESGEVTEKAIELAKEAIDQIGQNAPNPTLSSLATYLPTQSVQIANMIEASTQSVFSRYSIPAVASTLPNGAQAWLSSEYVVEVQTAQRAAATAMATTTQVGSSTTVVAPSGNMFTGAANKGVHVPGVVGGAGLAMAVAVGYGAVVV